jgi:hypothetical protein
MRPAFLPISWSLVSRFAQPWSGQGERLEYPADFKLSESGRTDAPPDKHASDGAICP